MKVTPLAALLMLMPCAAVAAGSGSLQSLCWSPAALAAKPDERLIRKLDGEPDTPPVQRSLAAFQPVPMSRMGSIRSVKIADGRKLIALTFDLCEAHGQVSGYDGDIVDTLRANGAKATFFAGGKWLLDHTERAGQLMTDPLFEIGNHNWSHANVRRVGPERVMSEITRTQAAYEKVRDDLTHAQCLIGARASQPAIPARMDLYRFPYGACNAEALQAVATQGLLDIQWDIAMADPAASQTADLIVEEVLHKVHPGSIIIGHANGRGVHTNEALQRLLPELKKRGYQFVTVDELLAAGTPVIAEECFNEKPGDLDRYDKPKETSPVSVSLRPESMPADGSVSGRSKSASQDGAGQSSVTSKSARHRRPKPPADPWAAIFSLDNG